MMSGVSFDCHDRRGDGTGIKWVEDRDATGHPTVPRTAPSTVSYPAPSVNSASDLKSWRKARLPSIRTFWVNVQVLCPCHPMGPPTVSHVGLWST